MVVHPAKWRFQATVSQRPRGGPRRGGKTIGRITPTGASPNVVPAAAAIARSTRSGAGARAAERLGREPAIQHDPINGEVSEGPRDQGSGEVAPNRVGRSL